ncbi:DUF1109 domain-containing protein [Sphingobium indicum]|uniref:DUF1109 domain-containing protein n=2 Tax=Sphingobium indicum TaxID=332055 RepID=A0A1L5BR72_SPHIB|nr:DUF1109 domain-containing protein [Sphingobium indicum]APL95359.1 hypothetical protein SIDU_13015 [Sphingobium indicum B90A]KEZ00406.1 hypothetical protein AI27_04285 [Sphingomonas sp. BHC-A]NYI22464.1 hypothetical protein [Sphingobium indicum]RYM02543.1 DUF1109 domain-containing protein [Sphingobium indicum]
MSSETLIVALSSDLAPVQRRSMLREGGLVLALGVVELALFVSMGVMRPDMHHITGSPFLIWRVGSLGLLAAVACVLAIRSFSPTARPRRGLMLACALAVAAIVGGAFVMPPGASDRALLDRIDPASGMLCAASIFVLSLPIVALLGALMRRAAPTQARLSALASGIAAGACGAFVFAFCCPFNDPLYVVVWYSVGCAAVAAAARWRLPRRFRL